MQTIWLVACICWSITGPSFTQPRTSRVQLRYVCDPALRINTSHDVVILSIGKLLHLLSIARMRHVEMQVAADRESPLSSIS